MKREKVVGETRCAFRWIARTNESRGEKLLSGRETATVLARGNEGETAGRGGERERKRAKRRRREESGGIRKGRREDEGGKRGFPVPER